MAQRTENEEIELKPVPETMSLCVNNCGVIGNPSTNNMCQNCFKATTTTTAISAASSSRSLKKRSDSSPPKTTTFTRIAGLNRPGNDDSEKKVVNRCSGCKRRVGLTGFRCRCGQLFCADHRYSDRHDCSYDYKTVGREAIARENPVVKAAKIIKV